MNLVLNIELKKKLENGDILVYSDGSWINLSKEEYIAKLTNEFNELHNKVNNLESIVNELNQLVKELRGED